MTPRARSAVGVEAAFDETAESITRLLEAQSEEIRLSATDSRLIRTVDWILNVQTDGAWGRASVATTAVVVIALADFIHGRTGSSELDERIDVALSDAGIFLEQKYRSNHFEFAVWDTSVAARALLRCAPDAYSLLAELTTWLIAYQVEGLNAGPHHLAQRAIFLVERGCAMDVTEPAALAVDERAASRAYAYSPYVIAQCLEAVTRARIDADIEPYREKLLRFLRRAVLDSANFVNICSALHGLSIARSHEAAEAMRTSVASLFGQTCFRDDGTWYHDDLATAWALIALSAHEREIVIRAPRSELVFDIDESLNQMRGHVARSMRARDWRWFAHVLVAFGAGAAISFYATYASAVGDLPGWLTWMITGLAGLGVVGVGAFAWHTLVQRAER